MKRIKRTIAAITLASTLIFGTGSLVHVRADQTVGPQGQQDTKSKGPSTGGQISDAEWAYLLWLIFMWLIWGGL
jgi:hypothetical protein